MLSLSYSIVSEWACALFGHIAEPVRVKPAKRRTRQQELTQAVNTLSAEDRRAFYSLFDELDKLYNALDADHARMIYLTLKCYHAKVLDESATIAWLAELARYTDLEQAYQIALQRYAQKGEA